MKKKNKNVENAQTIIAKSALTEKNQRDNNGNFFNAHTFQATAGEKLTVNLESSDFFPQLVISGPSNQIFTKDHHSESHKQARIILTVDETGIYQAIVTARQSGTTGHYIVSKHSTTTADLKWAEAKEYEQIMLQLYQQGKYKEALEAGEKAQALYNETQPSESLDSLRSQGLIHTANGRYSEAEPYFLKVLKTHKDKLDQKHPDLLAPDLNNLGNLYQAQGKYSEAEPHYIQALTIRQRHLGKSHLDVATSLNNLAELYQIQGRYSEAERYFLQALKIRQNSIEKRELDIATSLNNLALLYHLQKRYSDAEGLYVQALGLRQRQLGPGHPDVAMSLNNLAGLYQIQKRYSEAEAYYLKALKIRQDRLGKKHRLVSISLNNLARLYKEQCRYTEAEPLHIEALNIGEHVLGAEHPDIATTLKNLAYLYKDQGRYTETLDRFRGALEIEEEHLYLNLISGTEQQKHDYVTTLGGSTNWIVNFNLRFTPNNQTATLLALTTILRRKGRILDILNNNLRAIRSNLTNHNKQLLDNYIAANTQLANLTYQFSSEQRIKLKDLRKTAKALEAELNTVSREFQQRTKPVTLDSVQAALGPKKVLLEFIRYQPLCTQKVNSHYGLYVVNGESFPIGIDLGDTEKIDHLLKQFRQAICQDSSNIMPSAQALYEKLIGPVREYLPNNTHVIVAPDSQLCLIPFGSLVDGNKEYMASNFDISYLSSGRELLQNSQLNSHPNRSVILAAPNYDYAQAAKNTTQKIKGLKLSSLLPKPWTTFLKTGNSAQNLHQTPKVTFNSPSYLQRGKELDRLGNLKHLPGTAKEIKLIAPKLNNPHILKGQTATEEALKQLAVSPKILHIATHGFFLKGPGETRPINSPLGNRDLGEDFLISERQIRVPIENPLLRSGLALAGFNTRKSGSEDGVLTALEAANLDLRGTQLVVLSACQTGLGDVMDGEGVYGLRRAFSIAGAQSQLMSLWKVSDEGTKELMSCYYEKLMGGKGRTQALTETQREMIDHPKYHHPYYWAAFIHFGDWRPLPE